MQGYDVFKLPDGGYQLPLGIYYGLPEEVYHADHALGSSSIKALAQKPCKWQYDRLRPKKEVEAEHLVWGRAWHCRVLEGAEAFAERYARKPRPDDFPGCLSTVEDLKNFLKFNGQKLTGGKPELTERARAIEDCPPIFDDLLMDWIDAHPGHQELTPAMVQEIEDAVANMERDPTLGAVMQAGSLIDGAAEVSIFYMMDGVRRKCRLDYALPPTEDRAKAIVVDLKSFTNYRGPTDEEAAKDKVYSLCYDVQVADYMNGIRAGMDLLNAGAVYGDIPDNDHTLSFLSAPSFDWVWVMIRRDAGVIPVVLSIDTEDPLILRAQDAVTAALDAYRSYVTAWGHDQLWTPPPKMPIRLNASVMPTYNRGLIHEQPIDR